MLALYKQLPSLPTPRESCLVTVSLRQDSRSWRRLDIVFNSAFDHAFVIIGHAFYIIIVLAARFLASPLTSLPACEPLFPCRHCNHAILRTVAHTSHAKSVCHSEEHRKHPNREERQCWLSPHDHTLVLHDTDGSMLLHQQLSVLLLQQQIYPRRL